MSDTFEQRLLAYLDGMLDARSRHAFLSEVARDEEKQRMLDQYRQLDTALRDRGNPIAVPLRAQQALAQRIPSLHDAVPSTPLPPSGAGSAAAGRTVSALLGSGRRIVGLAVIGGMIVVGVSLLMLPGGSDHPVDRIPATSLPSGQPVHPGPVSPEASLPEAAGMQTERGRSGSHDGFGGRKDYRTAPSAAHVPHAPGERSNTSDAPETIVHPATERADIGAHPAGSSITESFSPHAASPHAASPHAASPHAALQHTAPGTGERMTAGMLETVHPMVLLSSAQGPERHGVLPHLPSRMLPSLFAGRLHLYLETGATPFTSAGQGNTETLPVSGMVLAGLRYRVDNHVSAGIDIGHSRFARERLSASRTPAGDPGGSVIVVIDRERASALHPWLRLHGVYTLNPESRLRVEADAGSGILLGEGNPLMLSSGLSLVYVMSTALQLRAGLHGSGTWMSPGAPSLPPVDAGDGVIGIIRRADTANRIFTTSLDVRIGIGVFLW